MQEVNGCPVHIVREMRHLAQNILTECGTILTREKWNVVEPKRERDRERLMDGPL